MATRFRLNHKVEEEDASALKLGPGTSFYTFHFHSKYLTVSYLEFNNAGCLLISEVKYLLENRDKDAPDTAVYNKTLEYVKTFTKFNTTDSASAVRECVAVDLFSTMSNQAGTLGPFGGSLP